jgi:hypothetical protein
MKALVLADHFGQGVLLLRQNVKDMGYKRKMQKRCDGRFLTCMYEQAAITSQRIMNLDSAAACSCIHFYAIRIIHRIYTSANTKASEMEALSWKRFLPREQLASYVGLMTRDMHRHDADYM